VLDLGPLTEGPGPTSSPGSLLALRVARPISQLRGKNYKHLKALYHKGDINGQSINKMLVDTGAAVNIMPYSVLRRLGRSIGDLIKINVTLSDFNGQTSEAQGVLNVNLTVGSKTVPTSFFIVNSKSTYTVLLGRDWIHANCCISSMMHQCLIQWDGDEVEVVHADDSIEISHTFGTQKIKSRFQESVWKAVIAWKLQKMG
jgi:hypothetical protein